MASTATSNGTARQRQRSNSDPEGDLERGRPQLEKVPSHHIPGMPDRDGLKRFAHRFLRKGRKKVGVWTSLVNIAKSSFLNLFIIFLPIAWALHFTVPHLSGAVFAFSFLAIVPLERLFDYCGEQMAFYCGKDLSDLIIITLNNAVEATLAIILLAKNEFRVLQATIIGVIVLHLLLIPGTAFITGGARVLSQDLTPHITELNHTLLTMGVLSLILPAAFFAALDRGSNVIIPVAEEAAGEAAVALLSDETRDSFLRLSRGIAIILLVMYICSRIYIHNPPGEGNALQVHESLPPAVAEHERKLEEEDPEVSQWVCIAVIVVAVVLMAITAEFLVESIESVNEQLGNHEEWFGLVLLPIVSFAADGAVAIIFFCRSLYHHWKHTHIEPISLAKARAIDLSIQFSLFWMPVFILLAWWTSKPLSLLFDLFEVALLVGACFLVNYVTADAKTNWAEGCAMVGFYVIIALTAWYYPGQPEIEVMLAPTSIEQFLANPGHEAAGAAATEAASEAANHGEKIVAAFLGGQ